MSQDNGIVISKTPTSLYREHIAGVDVLWQAPPLDAKGILFLAHGCSHVNTDFWARTKTTCPDCLGLPEEVAIVNFALERNLAAVAVSSENRKSKCWSLQDGPTIAQVLATMQDKLSDMNKLPIYAFGASSGGFFVQKHLPKSLLAVGRKLNGLIGEIAGAKFDTNHFVDKDFLPDCAVYITMNRDAKTDKQAASAVQELPSQGMAAKHIRVPPLPLTLSFFTDRIGSKVYSEEASARMVQALKDAEYLDSAMLLQQDPRRSSWRSVLKPFSINDTLVADQSPLSEVMNVAYGRHEMTRDGVAEALDFCMAATKIG